MFKVTQDDLSDQKNGQREVTSTKNIFKKNQILSLLMVSGLQSRFSQDLVLVAIAVCKNSNAPHSRFRKTKRRRETQEVKERSEAG